MTRAHGHGAPSRAGELPEPWGGLVQGRWALAGRLTIGGRRYLLARENPSVLRERARLSARERRCSRLAADGRGNAAIAYRLGLAESTVASHVASALRKLRLERRELLRELVLATPPPEPQPWSGGYLIGRLPRRELPACLSHAERSVAELVLDGLDDEAVARRRGTSPRTVANQLRAIYRKLAVHSRGDLVRALLRVDRSQRPPGGPSSWAGLRLVSSAASE